ncbi:LAQU0S01e13256g1_1 [Lachancea quebecensis]|uniref:GPI-anchored wall transfer protein n=1 Tax=Lachancea quebecensis TaxID=1654605 RepID=A0A0P1KMM1_9SACH|nr:LAQU0S01e13256g1_1 [Lachancea quebecensis]
MEDLKLRKEQFVSGLTGSSIQEINVVTSVALCGYVCWSLLRSSVAEGKVMLLVDFFFNWCAILLSITTYADNPLTLNLLLIVPPFLFWLYARPARSPKAISRNASHNTEFKLMRRPFITAYRGSMMIVTALAILAVDFRIFPRRFAKVETWGTSLMDLGVGSFVFSNGLVSSRALLRNMLEGRRISLMNKVKHALRSSGTILLLGLLRLYFVKNLEYQEHVTEYGVHWNFFITLSMLPIAMIPIDAIAKYAPRIVIALVISSVYELFMVFNKDLLPFLIGGTRETIISANREGIFSFFGYCAIFLCGQATGFYTLGNVATKNNLIRPSVQPVKDIKRLSTWGRLTSKGTLCGLLIWSFLTLSLTQIVFAWHPFNVSRRFANLPYVLWVVSFNLGALSLYCLVDKIFENSAIGYETSVSLEAMNSNGLFLFLLANVSTGLVNMIMPTIDAPPVKAFSVLLLYASFLASVSIFMLKKKIFIKL